MGILNSHFWGSFSSKFGKYTFTLEPKLLFLPKKRLEVTFSAKVVLTPFLDRPNLPKEGLSGLKGKFSWRDI